MKKIFSIFMAIFLLLNTIGYNVYAHYCGEKLEETSVIIKPSDACCDEGGQDMPCCKSDETQIVIEDEFIRADSNEIFSVKAFSLLFCTIPASFFTHLTSNLLHFEYSTNFKAGITHDYQILFSVFRI